MSVCPVQVLTFECINLETSDDGAGVRAAPGGTCQGRQTSARPSVINWYCVETRMMGTLTGTLPMDFGFGDISSSTHSQGITPIDGVK